MLTTMLAPGTPGGVMARYSASQRAARVPTNGAHRRTGIR